MFKKQERVTKISLERFIRMLPQPGHYGWKKIFKARGHTEKGTCVINS